MRSSELMIIFNKKAVVLLILGVFVGLIIGYIAQDYKLGIVLGVAMGLAITIFVNFFLMQSAKPPKETFKNEV